MLEVKDGTVKKPISFTQSNSLIEARYSMTTGEMHLIFSILSMIRNDDNDFKKYQISVRDLASLWGISTKYAYKEIDKITDRLISRVLYLKRGNDKFLKTNWLASAEYENGILELEISQKLRPYLLNLKREFKQFELLILLEFRSSYSVRIYMLLKQYENIGFREFDLHDFKDKLDINSKTYSEFKYIKKFIINKAKKEFDKKDKETGLHLSDINFNLETIRTGRKITRLRFIIIKQETKHYIELNPNENNEDDKHDTDQNTPEEQELTPIITSLIEFGISKKQAFSLQEKYGEHYLQEKINYTQKQEKSGKLKTSLSGFLIRAIEENYKTPEDLKAEKEQREKERKEQEAEWEKQLNQARKAAIDHYLKNLDKAQKENLKNEFEHSKAFQYTMMNDHYVHSLYRGMSTLDEVLNQEGTRKVLRTFIFLDCLDNIEHLKTLDTWKKHHNLN